MPNAVNGVVNHVTSPTPMPATTYSAARASAEHVIHLSSIEHCMPRAYIRVCLAYQTHGAEAVGVALRKLQTFVRTTVDAKPYLAGYVTPMKDSRGPTGRVEIRFTDEDFLNFPSLQIRKLTQEEMPFTYAALNEARLPPSTIRPDVISALPEGADENRAPVFRIQANIVDGGLIVSIYLHHCISDGAGLGLLASGSVLHDDFTFERYPVTNGLPSPSLTERLEAFAVRKTCARQAWSWSSHNDFSYRHLDHKFITNVTCVSHPTNPPGRGCIFSFPDGAIQDLRDSLRRRSCEEYLSFHDVLQAMLWHHMTRARRPSLPPIYARTHSKLLVPVNIRSRLKPPLEPHYFGSAVDFASVQMPLNHLSQDNLDSMASTAIKIRQSIALVDEPYIRSTIALANSPDASVDVRDLLASNMNRVTAADMYITSWYNLDLYSSDLGMDLGPPDWVRKPWSKDPGSCIILPKDSRKDHVEVVVQMTEVDMARLLEDTGFMSYVSDVVE